jgi:hypothetical protein
MAAILAIAFAFQAQSNPVEAKVDLTSRMLVTTRDQFRMCLQTSIADAGRRAHIVEHLADSQSRIQQRPDWQRAPVTVPPLEMDCGGVQLPDGRLERGVTVQPGVTTRPSVYRSMILVLDESEAESKLGAEGAILIPYEMMQIDDHNAVEVTSVLVVRESFLDSPEFNDWYYPIAVGMPPLVERLSGEEDRNVK